MLRTLRLFALATILCILALPMIAEPYNYAAAWQQWPRAARVSYLEGLHDGTDRAYWALTGFLTLKFISSHNDAAQRIWASKEFSDEVSKLKYDFRPTILEPVLTDLYSDPANAFIPFAQMAAVATHKLRGADVTSDILEARKAALKIDQLFEGH